MRPYPHCTHCGTKLPEGDWPKTCTNPDCGRMHFLNPTPVAVLLVPVDDGVMTIRRAIAPQIGELAFPGGYIDLKETWQQAAARELREETGLLVDASDVSHFATVSSERGDGVILIFGTAPRQDRAFLNDFQVNDEVSEVVVVNAPQDLAFPLHTDMLKAFFD